MYDRHQTIVR